MFDFRLDEVEAFVRLRKAKTVALQMPEGLKARAAEVAEEIERRTGARCLILADPCYGACDVDTHFREFADALVHFGHSEIPSMRSEGDILFVEVTADVDIWKLLQQARARMKDRIGLVATVQHIDLLESVRAELEKEGKVVLIGKGDGRIKHKGQVLGCNASAALSVADQVEQFIFIGTGNFHPLEVAIETGKEVLILDPTMGQVRDVEDLKERVLRQRHAATVLAAKARSFGLVVSTKAGQHRLDLAFELKEMIEQTGRTAEVIVTRDLDPTQLLAFQVDAFVSTACPRIAIDDYMRFKRPIITPIELEIALGKRAWEDYRLDAITG
jgi:2-(3-amino-3-carboxypropyl)histidine synthase